MSIKRQGARVSVLVLTESSSVLKITVRSASILPGLNGLHVINLVEWGGRFDSSSMSTKTTSVRIRASISRGIAMSAHVTESTVMAPGPSGDHARPRAGTTL